jgi:signal-transduction protein with cAMP-binding, CBS, and nucleotidyltransferase domain
MNNQFIAAFNALASLSSVAIEDLGRSITSKTFNRNEHILSAGSICRELYFIDQGLVKMNFNNDGNEFIMRFFSEHSIVTGLDSYISKRSSKYSILALETTTVSCIPCSVLEDLCIKHHCIETANRKFLSSAALNDETNQ